MDGDKGAVSDERGPRGIAFLLVQLGFHGARLFAERLEPLGLEPRQYGMLARLAWNEGSSQQAIGELMGLHPTRMVFLVDELEKLGLAERRRNPADRRSYALYLTDRGREVLNEAQDAVAAHELSFGTSLSAHERRQLGDLLRRVADEQGLSRQSLPGT